MTTMPCSALIFDLDGVIIDSESLHNAAVAAAVRKHGVELPAAIFADFMGIPDEVFLAHASEHYLGGRVTPADLLAAKQRCYLAMQEQLQPVPGALEFLTAVRPQVQQMALVTSSLRHNQQLAFARFGLAPCFDVVITAEDVTHTKPHPEPYQRAVERLGLPAAACLVFEDSLHGVRSALAAGCPVIALTTSYPAEALHAAGATHVCADYAEIAATLGMYNIFAT